MTDSHQGMTRRQLLKRGAAFGGAVAWVTPMVQAVGMRAAAAQETSPDCATYCIKLVIDNVWDGQNWLLDPTDDWSTVWEAFKTPANDCLRCPPDVDPKVDAPTGATSGMAVTGDPNPPEPGEPEVGVTIQIPDGVEIVLSGDPTPDPLVHWNGAAVRCGNSGVKGCNYDYQTSNGSITFQVCDNGRAITQIEMIIRYCGPDDVQ